MLAGGTDASKYQPGTMLVLSVPHELAMSHKDKPIPAQHFARGLKGFIVRPGAVPP